MKRLLLGILLLAGIAAGQQQKTIKDPAEYQEYISAQNMPEGAPKAAAMESFASTYPQSVMFTDALEEAMAGYQKAGNVAKVVAIARRIVAVEPAPLRALAILVTFDRVKVTNGNRDPLSEICGYATEGAGLVGKWPKPDGMNDADFQKLQNQLAVIFYGGVGFCHLQGKNFTDARDAYTKSFQIDPTNLQDVYQLAVADLEMTPIDMNGVWYCSKAMHLAEAQNNTPAVNSMVAYCKARYKKYHGSDEGWEQIVKSSTSQTVLPANFASSIKPALTPCDLAVQAVQQNDVGSLSFGDKEFILSKATCSPANKEAADKVWQSILALEKFGDARLQIPVKVIAVATDSLDCAVADDNRESGKVDLHVMMEKPMLHPPAVGSEISLIGVIKAYNTSPFLFVMEKGSLAAAK